MKKLNAIIALMICFTLLTACTGKANSKPKTSSKTDATSEQIFLTPEYDYSVNQLKLLNLSTSKVTAAYSFETAQSPMLIEKIRGGVVMLSSQAEADVQNKGGVSIINGDDSAKTLVYLQFDEKMNLKKQYELTDPQLIENLRGYTFTVSPDGEEIAYTVDNRLYIYKLKAQKQREITPKVKETVYYEAIHYSASGTNMTFFGSVSDRDGTAYGSVDLNDESGKVFFADKFSAMALSVNGEYAVISETIKPNSLGGPAETGSILYVDCAKQQGKQIKVQSGVESGIATVSADGRYVVTCKGGDDTKGILTAYKTADGRKVIEQPYTMKTVCKPYKLLMQGQSAYAVLATDKGNLLSPAVVLK